MDPGWRIGARRLPPACGRPPATRTHAVIVGGMPGRQITLIAVSAAVLAATVAVIPDRTRTARRHLATPSA